MDGGSIIVAGVAVLVLIALYESRAGGVEAPLVAGNAHGAVLGAVGSVIGTLGQAIGGSAALIVPPSGATGQGGLTPDQEIVARTLYGETRGQGGMATGVAWLIRNRVYDPLQRFGFGWVDVCQKHSAAGVYQFSSWDARVGSNHQKMLSVTNSDPDYLQCIDLAKAIIAGTAGADPTGGATFCHDTSISDAAFLRGFSSPLTFTVQLGSMRFFRQGLLS